MDLFAGICVRDYEAAKPWYERLLGSEPALVAHETECVWQLWMSSTRFSRPGFRPPD